MPDSLNVNSKRKIRKQCINEWLVPLVRIKNLQNKLCISITAFYSNHITSGRTDRQQYARRLYKKGNNILKFYYHLLLGIMTGK